MENVENIILEHLRHIRNRVDQIAEDMQDMKHRMSSVETGVVSVKRDIAAATTRTRVSKSV